MEQEAKIQILRDLIQIPTVNGNEGALSEYLVNLLDQHGIASQVTPLATDADRTNLIVEVGTGNTDQILGFTGHQDTVAVGDEAAWQYPPFAATVVGDKLYGRGAADMKSGLAAEVIALIELVESGTPLPGRIRLIITAGEEFGAPGAYQVAPELLTDLDALVVGEATDGDVTYAHSGSFNYRIVSKGKAAHSSVPTQGINAIQGLAHYMAQEAQLFTDLPVDDQLGKVQHSVTVIQGGEQINTIPDAATLFGNVRPTPAFDNQSVRDLIQQTIDTINRTTDYQLELQVIHDFYPVESVQQSWLVQTAVEIAQAAYPDRNIQAGIDNGATDASVFVQHQPDLPVIVLGPDKAGTSHQINEHTTISSFLTTIEIYKHLAEQFFATPK
ncbi:ArgE/DapE family deacylase [Fructilactobacillus myrtifloralis]|uniref:Probable succinyl-diaminopimelate desuccinylase n=1 Tax=Fructilactobacillus myrtifloralis TaxID=2940301 RepID=A0ABY5BSV6_9LACO|nr:ArgE/DapE family deacylase [Fructilactobacillus myrtifloralis]USS85449.1 ArgE/DapE family deacylase [Fructilactobacillus myrtifloralis]